MTESDYLNEIHHEHELEGNECNYCGTLTENTYCSRDCKNADLD